MINLFSISWERSQVYACCVRVSIQLWAFFFFFGVLCVILWIRSHLSIPQCSFFGPKIIRLSSTFISVQRHNREEWSDLDRWFHLPPSYHTLRILKGLSHNPWGKKWERDLMDEQRRRTVNSWKYLWNDTLSDDVSSWIKSINFFSRFRLSFVINL